MPNSSPEAFASGLPITFSSRESMLQVLPDGGVYVDTEDDVSIAEASDSLISDAELRAGSASRPRELASACSWARCARETFAFAVRGQALVPAGG